MKLNPVSLAKTISAFVALSAAGVGAACGSQDVDRPKEGQTTAAPLQVPPSLTIPIPTPTTTPRPPVTPPSVVLLSGRESHSIEVFETSGAWRQTFASTGARAPFGLSQSPLTGDVYVTTNTDTILRYSSAGTPLAAGPLVLPQDGNVSCSALFDSAGDLYVATYYGGSAQDASTSTVHIYEYLATALSSPNPPLGPVITTDLMRGDQLAFDAQMDICLGSFISETVECFDATGALVHDYRSALLASTGVSGPVQPAGVAFDTAGRLFVSSVFLGDIVSESSVYGSTAAFATGLVHDTQFITFDSSKQNLYVATFHEGSPRVVGCASYECQDNDFSSDVVYRIAPSGVVTPFITDHAYAPTQIIFGRVSGCQG